MMLAVETSPAPDAASAAGTGGSARTATVPAEDAVAEQPGRPGGQPGRPAGHRRARGLDVLRGLVVAWLLVVVHTPTSGLRGHAAWFGWDHSDVFFPMFVLLAGAGLAWQTRERMPWGRLLRRAVVLVVLGLFVNAWLGAGADLSQLRLTGVLQRIALVGLLGAAVVAVLRRRWPAVTLAALVVAGAWGLVLARASAGCPAGLPTVEGCGTFVELDRAVFGEAHVYAPGSAEHDPEGLASTAGALATFLAGYAAASLLHALRARTATARTAALLVMAAGWALAWPVLELLQPVGKRMWTPSFVALHAALGIALLAVTVLVFDSARPDWLRRGLDALAWPVVALGRNALVVWTGVFLAGKALTATPVGAAGVPLGEHLLQQHGAAGWLALACALHAARWYVRL
jgi:predicted acyltransferase